MIDLVGAIHRGGVSVGRAELLNSSVKFMREMGISQENIARFIAENSQIPEICEDK
ncbi:MAG: hypothetical protein IJR85_04150 [Synergistaceae bacterium]|nr:hypothetical protein [Synergistaceae bacterium]